MPKNIRGSACAVDILLKTTMSPHKSICIGEDFGRDRQVCVRIPHLLLNVQGSLFHLLCLFRRHWLHPYLHLMMQTRVLVMHWQPPLPHPQWWTMLLLHVVLLVLTTPTPSWHRREDAENQNTPERRCVVTITSNNIDWSWSGYNMYCLSWGSELYSYCLSQKLGIFSQSQHDI